MTEGFKVLQSFGNAEDTLKHLNALKPDIVIMDINLPGMLVIHPDECIDCGACVPACPVEAIFALDETPDKWKQFIPVNAEFFQKQ